MTGAGVHTKIVKNQLYEIELLNTTGILITINQNAHIEGSLQYQSDKLKASFILYHNINIFIHPWKLW